MQTLIWVIQKSKSRFWQACHMSINCTKSAIKTNTRYQATK